MLRRIRWRPPRPRPVPRRSSRFPWSPSVMLPPDFRISDGLVVTPSSRPRSLSSRISLTSAVSTKNFMAVSLAISVCRAISGRRLPAFALAETRGKVTRHERRFASSTGPDALGAGAGADAGGAALHLCGARRHGCRAGLDRARAARPARSGRHRLGQRDRSGRSEEARSRSPRSSTVRRSTTTRAVSSTGSRPTRCRRPAWSRACFCARPPPSIRNPGRKGCSAPNCCPTA